MSLSNPIHSTPIQARMHKRNPVTLTKAELTTFRSLLKEREISLIPFLLASVHYPGSTLETALVVIMERSQVSLDLTASNARVQELANVSTVSRLLELDTLARTILHL